MIGAKIASMISSSRTEGDKGTKQFEPCDSASDASLNMSWTTAEKHLRNMMTDVQLPASLESSFAVVTFILAARSDKVLKASRFAQGAPTVVKPRSMAQSEETTSAPAALKTEAATTSFSVDPKSLPAS